MITLIVIMDDGECHYLKTNLQGYELFVLMKELKQKKQIKEVR